MVLAGVVEPMLWGKKSFSEYTTVESLLHWGMTILCWSIVWGYLWRCASRQGLALWQLRERPSAAGAALAVVLALGCVWISNQSTGTLKILREWDQMGPLLFLGQHLYYLAEMGLVLLILAFGQAFGERMWSRRHIPWGGILLACTWGGVHALSKGSLTQGVEGFLCSLLYGVIYLLLKKNTGISYALLTVTFVL